jgi:hypothetical protein
MTKFATSTESPTTITTIASHVLTGVSGGHHHRGSISQNTTINNYYGAPAVAPAVEARVPPLVGPTAVASAAVDTSVSVSVGW